MNSMIMRYLSEDSDDEEDSDHHVEAKYQVMTAKIVLAVVVLLCGLFVFLPYAKCFRKTDKG